MGSLRLDDDDDDDDGDHDDDDDDHNYNDDNFDFDDLLQPQVQGDHILPIGRIGNPLHGSS